ncbi:MULTISPECIES: phosphoribosylformylglycinamidine synthase subunit PurS [Fictibacillus]|jgi:phosphoribosylformylglycinamidine synthase subunit PurS|uniref:phosphoribosylformylglycinamidine synthase subunit PurS n=1 Tax=Fictibacillus TaxID=1329200 RepID=UPI00102A58A5|nr:MULTISPECIES: phosphoribosylformylglycinamidine synthase subunit PurS [Fictibacillus]MCM3720195.1 phosphoribosylformylglycinamidine synthase subunit PurS [Fictibacillus phosphorivorans]MCM3777885.1 phosphoribosylformylglycinamidine synthase subunit PurS [Fictibacillus phosphorivorans]RZT16569.1 phosphoribosylformylglycinamidine synthase [Fictibacillus sp. BK138]
MYKVKVYVTLRESVLDPQGKAVMHSLHKMGQSEVEDVRIGKYLELTLQKGDYDLDEKIVSMCSKLLSNPVIEDYRYEVEEVVAQ